MVLIRTQPFQPFQPFQWKRRGSTSQKHYGAKTRQNWQAEDISGLRAMNSLRIIPHSQHWLVLLAFCGFCLSVKARAGLSRAETVNSFRVMKGHNIATLDELIRTVASKPEGLAIAFQCRKLYPPLELTPHLLEVIKEKGLDASKVIRDSTESSYYVGVQVGDSSGYVRKGTPIEGIGATWSDPVNIAILTNDLAFVAILHDESHTVTGRHFTNNANEFGLSANQGFSVVRVMLQLDLENTHARVMHNPRDGKLRVAGQEGGEREYTIIRDDSGAAVSIFGKERGSVYSLVSSNGGFVYQRSINGKVSFQLLFENVFTVAQPEQVFSEILAALFPSPETYVSFHGGASNFICKAAGINFSDVAKSLPFGGPLVGRAVAPLTRWILVGSFLGGLVLLVALASKKWTKAKANPL